MSIRPRYIGLLAGIALEISLHLAVELLDKVEAFQGLLWLLVIAYSIICLPVIFLPLQGFAAEGFVIVFWGTLGFLLGIYLERRKRRRSLIGQ